MSRHDEDGDGDGSDGGGLRDRLERIAREAGMFAGVVVWMGFWLVVVRLHLLRGHALEAAVTAALTMLPILAGYGWRWAGRLDAVSQPEVPRPTSSDS